jgi:Protein of unknown function (DUF3106)
MNRLNLLFVPLCAVLLAFASITAAQTPPTSRMPEQSMSHPGMAHPSRPQPPEWERLSPAQREAVIAVVRDRWNSNPRQRARMLQHAERWQRMHQGFDLC